MTAEGLYTVKEIADILCVSLHSVYRFAESGNLNVAKRVLQGHRVRLYFSQEEVDRLVNNKMYCYIEDNEITIQELCRKNNYLHMNIRYAVKYGYIKPTRVTANGKEVVLKEDAPRLLEIARYLPKKKNEIMESDFKKETGLSDEQLSELLQSAVIRPLRVIDGSVLVFDSADISKVSQG